MVGPLTRYVRPRWDWPARSGGLDAQVAEPPAVQLRGARMHLTRCLSTRLVVGVTAVAVPLGLMTPSDAAAPAKVAAAKAAPADRTSAREAKRVDSVPTPKLGWYPCYGYAQCATV